MLKTIVAAFGLVLAAGVAGCSGSNAVDNSIAETNLTTIDELPANDAAFGNDAVLLNDTAYGNASEPLEGAGLNAADPIGNAIENGSAL